MTALVFSMIVLSFGQVVARNIFSTGFIWVDEVLRMEVLWVAFVGAALATEYNQHIKIDFLASIIHSDFSKKIIGISAHLFAFFICSLLFIVALDYLHTVGSDSTSTIIRGIPDWSFRCVIPYCFFMVSIRSVINIMKICNEKDFQIC
ncbi:MAG: TRAP transporter small permease subunit [Desulfobacterales bacterium]|nr:TRAP transporter small permease subunit [Desulfobacterales bacterium]